MRRFRKAKADPEKAGKPEAARLSAIALLAGRDFASSELTSRLESRGYEPAVAAEAVAELLNEKVLDDARYAEHYVTYHANRGQGPVRIRGALKALGLDAALVEAALASGPAWAGVARDARIRKFGPGSPGTWAEKGRQSRFLQYRGFSSDHIRAALGGDIDPDETP